MKQRLTGLSERYLAALRTHLKPGPRASLQPALKLGRQAVALGLETLDLAQIHEQSLAALELRGNKNGLRKRAKSFFAEANIPIEETHRAARQSKDHLVRVRETLGRRTVELAASKCQLQHVIVRRKVLEEAHEKSDKRHDKSLEESLNLQKRLRQLTHKVIEAQENERHKISHELRDEIAQTLLGINVRLLSLKQGARGNLKGFKNEIASTQRLVVNSARAVRKFARKLGVRHPA